MKRSDLGRIGEKVGVLAIMEPQTLQEIAPSNTFVKRTRNGKGLQIAAPPEDNDMPHDVPITLRNMEF